MHISCLYLFRAASLACFSCLLVSGAVAAVASDEYDAVIIAARQGDAESALAKLTEWHHLYPGNSQIVFDLATVLNAAGKHEAALEHYDRIVQPGVPVYAIKAVAYSARVSGRARQADAAYRLLLTKAPDDSEAHAGLAYTWMAQDHLQQAFDYLKSRLPASSGDYVRRDAPLIVALAELHEQRNEWLLAAETYQNVLRVEPHFRYAQRGRIFSLSRAGAFQLAQRLALNHPEAFEEKELQRLAQDAVARTVIFGQARQEADEDPARRYATTDFALQQNAKITSEFGENALSHFDRLVALRDRSRMQDTIELYESLVSSNADIPPYARIAAADAYLHLEKPEVARDLYLVALDAASSTNAAEAADWQIALMYAYSEAEQHDEAETLADRVLRESPAFRHKGTAAIESPNEEYARAALMAALMRLYSDRLEQAQQRLAELRALAPDNAGIRSAWAALQSARERPRAALEEFTLLQLDEPQSADAAIGQASTLLALNRLDEAREASLPLLTNYPESKAVRNLEREIESYDSLHLKLETTLGRGASVAGAEAVVNATLYSSPLTNSIGSQYRVFSRVSHTEGETATESPVSRTRAGAGLDYRMGDIHAEVEVNHAAGDATRNGFAGALSWSLSDSWQVHAGVDTNINDLPAAAFHEDITGRAVKAGAAWSAHESRKAGAEMTHIRFSDDNKRDAIRLWWNERWISGPRFKLDTTFAFSASTNSLEGTSYFNPEQDQEASVTVAGEWLGWRHYQRAFRQRLSLTAGHYAQQGFSGGAIGDLRYEHDWRQDPSLSLRYGIGHAFHPYDGEREYRNYAFLNLYWRMK